MKTCKDCNIEKEFECFSIRILKNGTITYRNQCKSCCSKKEKERRNNNLEAFKKKDKEYYEKNKESLLVKSKIYQEINREKLKESKKQYYQKNIEKIKEYHSENKTKRNERIKNKRKTNPLFAIKESLRARIHETLNKKNTSTFTLIGISNKNLKVWIESQFDQQMKWENYCTYWVIDHVIPVSFYDLTSKDEQLKCFNWTNLRPLEKIKNMEKSDKILIDEIQNHINTIKNHLIINEGYQAYYENSMWQRVELWYGKNSTDEENFMIF